MNIAIIFFALAFIALAISGATFVFRAFTNQKAWNGMVAPMAVTGFILLVIALILIYIAYPK